jgi:hypothetical protein
MKFRTAMTLTVSIVALAGCQSHANSVSGAPAIISADTDPNEAIRKAIQAHLAHNGNLNLSSFDTQVKQVTVEGENAQAQVEFHVKNGSGSMQLTYTLAKHDGAWVVAESTPRGSNFSHPALDKTQPPAPSGNAGGDSAIFRALDNFHGGAARPPQSLPPGHPPVAVSPKDTKPEMH